MSRIPLSSTDLAKNLEARAALVPGSTPEAKPDKPTTPTPQSGKVAEREDKLHTEKDGLLKTKMSKASLREQIEQHHAKELRGLPGGVFNAPKLAHMVETMLERFVATGMVDPELKFDVMLASTPDINGWVKMDHGISDAKVFYVTLTKGLLDLVSDTQMARDLLGPRLAAEVAKNGEAVIAAVLAHELGHAMNGDLENIKVTTRVFNELAADQFSVELLARAGYAPEAAIELMRCFESLHKERTSIASRVAQLTDEHPKPRFRIASLVDLVETLKRTAFARQDFGLPERGVKTIPARPLPRDAENEHVSKQGLQGVQRRLDGSAYTGKSTRDKLRYLEQYFASYNAQNDVMERQTAVAIVGAYDAILQQATSINEIDQIIVSHRAFESTIGDLAGVKDDRPEGNVRAASRKLKSDAVARKVDLVQAMLGGQPLTVAAFDDYAQHIDRRVLSGMLIASCRRASSLAELAKIIETRSDASLRLRNDGAGKRTPDSLDVATYRAAAERAVDLTGSLAGALDFLQANVTIRKSHHQDYEGGEWSQIELPGETEVFTGLFRRALERPGIDLSGFIARMEKPQTAIDRAYAVIFQRIRFSVWTKVKEERGEAANLDVTSQRFTYGVGRSRPVHRKLSPDLVKLIHISGGGAAVGHYFNIVAGRQYTLPDALSLIERACPSRAAAWQAVAPRLLEGRDPRRGDDPHSQLRLVVERLVDTGVVEDEGLARALATKGGFKLKDLAGSSNPYLADVHAASTRSRELHFELVNDMLDTVIATSEIGEPSATGEDKKSLSPLPTLSPANGFTVPPDQRVAYIDKVAKAEASRRLTVYAPRLEATRQVFVEGLDELISEKRITTAVRDELLAGLDEVVACGKRIGAGAENEASTYVALRRLRLMAEVLNHHSIGFDKKLTKPAVHALAGMCDASYDRPTTASNARQLLSAFLVASNDALGKYLENPTDDRVEGIGLGIAEALAERVAFYEGLGPIGNGADIFGFDAATYFARTVHSPRRLSGTNEIKFNDGIVLGAANRSRLAPFGPAFEALVTGDVGGHRTGWQAGSWYKDLIESAWPYVLHRALTEQDPVNALGFALGYIESVGSSTEVVTKFSFAMLTRALELVESKADMDVYASLFALFVDGTNFGKIDAASFMNAELKDFAKLGQLRYRQHFYDRVVTRLQEFQSWRGLREGVSTTFYKTCAEIARRLGNRAEKWRLATDAGYDPILTSLWLLKKTVVPSLSDKPWLKRVVSKIQGKAAEAYTHCLVNVGFDTGRISRERLFADMQRTNVWSEKVDTAIASYVRAGNFEKGWTKAARRDFAVNLTKQVKALALREQLYRDVLTEYGEVTPSLMNKAKNYWKLYQAFAKAKELWTEPVLRELEKTSTIIEAWKITERAWEDFVKERAAERGVDRTKALLLLKELYDAKVVVDCPPAGEIAGVFPEGSAHRDGFLEAYVKARPMTVEQMKMFQTFKSRNTETPYHKLAKAFFEFIDDEAGRLETCQRADVALYLAGVTQTLPPATEDRLKDVLKGNHKRRKVMAQTEAQLRPSELREFVAQAHPDEKLVAFRGLLLSGVIGDAKAEAVLTEKLLFQDPTMPKYLVKLLKLFLRVIDDNERSIYLSWLLANSNGKPLSGPEIVRFLVEKGGVVAAKLAQLVASYGFDLPPEYSAALEKFKGKAQKIEKAIFMEEVKKRLPADKYDQIKTFDEELGSGSFKIGYAATLKDGRRVVIMMPRSYVIERTAREFEITRRMLDEIMNDPELARDNYAPLRAEVERIVKHEMNFASEAKYMIDHKANTDARPLLVRVLGSEMKVLVPQPLEGWHNEDILVEEYVEAKGFTKLPARALFGWSQEKLARAALAEVLNQMMSFARPDLLVGGKVTLDIDPHEENQLATTSWFGRKAMVNIDLGQSVTIDPEQVRGLVQMLAFIKFGQIDEAVAKADDYMDFSTAAERDTFRQALATKRQANGDPFEVLGQTLEETGIKGVFLKPEYLYLQKLFATIAGLKRHIRDPGFIMKRAERIFALHAVSSPQTGIREAKAGWLELQRLRTQGAKVGS